jgi:hypothetical protein
VKFQFDFEWRWFEEGRERTATSGAIETRQGLFVIIPGTDPVADVRGFYEDTTSMEEMPLLLRGHMHSLFAGADALVRSGTDQFGQPHYGWRK